MVHNTAKVEEANGYCDANTTYIQAGVTTTGGSSGSPAVDCSGHAVGLNTSRDKNSSARWFLPLDQVQRTLEQIRREAETQRETVQAI